MNDLEKKSNFILSKIRCYNILKSKIEDYRRALIEKIQIIYDASGIVYRDSETNYCIYNLPKDLSIKELYRIYLEYMDVVLKTQEDLIENKKKELSKIKETCSKYYCETCKKEIKREYEANFCSICGEVLIPKDIFGEKWEDPMEKWEKEEEQRRLDEIKKEELRRFEAIKKEILSPPLKEDFNETTKLSSTDVKTVNTSLNPFDEPKGDIFKSSLNANRIFMTIALGILLVLVAIL